MSLISKLAEKALHTLNQRGRDNGYDKKPGTAQEERSAAQIARVFNELTGHRLSTTDAWTFLQVLKLVRMENQIKTGSGDLLDSCIDMVSYGLLKAETALQENRPAQAAVLVEDTEILPPRVVPPAQMRIATGNFNVTGVVDEPATRATVRHDR